MELTCEQLSNECQSMSGRSMNFHKESSGTWIIPLFATIVFTVKYFVKCLCGIGKISISFIFNFQNKLYQKKDLDNLSTIQD